MHPAGFRSPDEDAMVQAAHQRAMAAYSELTGLARQAQAANAARLAQGLPPIEVGQTSPPQVAPHAPAADQVRLLDGQAEWYGREAARLQAQLAYGQRSTASAGEPEATLGPGPREVPAALCFAELARGPWRWLRWLLFPPVTMLVAFALGATSTVAPLAPAALLLLAVMALWALGALSGLARIRLLARAEVATVLQKTQRFGATRNKNVPMLVARGWDVSVESFTGMTKHTELTVQTSRGVIGKVTVSHGPDFHGVVLVDPDTGEGLANLDLGSVPRPAPGGGWRASLSTRVWVTSILAFAMTAALVGAALYAAAWAVR